MLSQSVVVAMPAYNEAIGIGEFLAEIDAALAPHVGRLVFVVVDDASTTPLAPILDGRTWLAGTVDVVTNNRNLGHGPSALRAYRRGLAHDPDVLIHVDGDGQFLGDDFPALLQGIASAEVVRGERVSRCDPWFRRLLSLGVRRLIAHPADRSADVNTPLRAYHPSALARLLACIPADALVPHVHFSRLEHQLDLRVAKISVAHRPRRGTTSTGSTWSRSRSTRIPSIRLLRFCLAAMREVRWLKSVPVPAARESSSPSR